MYFVLKNVKKFAIYFVFLLLIVVFSVLSPAFLNFSNLIQVARQVSMIGIASVGMMFVMLTGGIDLSIGSMVSIVNIMCALMIKAGMHPVLAVLISIAISTVAGIFNGLMVTKIHMTPLIATLGMMSILAGISYIVCGGMPIYGFPKGFAVLGQGYVGPFPIPVLIMVLILGIGSFILNKTYFGRYFYSIGGSEEVSKLSGVNVDKVKLLVYALSGFFAGLAGVIMLSRLNSGQAITGKGFEFEVLTAVVLGGVSTSGGVGKISNVIVGVLIIGILSNGLILINVSEYYQQVIKGIVLLIAVGFDCMQRNRVNKGKKSDELRVA